MPPAMGMPEASQSVLVDSAGTRLVSSSVRMLSSYMDRIVMAMPVPRADGLPGCDIQFEVSFPVSRYASNTPCSMHLLLTCHLILSIPENCLA